ncbi:MAG: FMN-binding negative transcriptional regulator [Pseudomonadota bacterium]
MHPSSIFHTDEDAARAIVRNNPLATLAANGPEGPVVAIVPVVWSEDGTKLVGHVGRKNTFWTALQTTEPMVSAVFRSSDAYVSASAYPTKAEHGRVVPTWNYIAAEARGRLRFNEDAGAILESVEKLSNVMEADRAAPWAVSDAPETYIDRLLTAIVAFELHVDDMRGVRKLSQNKSDAERAGVVADLASHPVAEEMEALR